MTKVCTPHLKTSSSVKMADVMQNGTSIHNGNHNHTPAVDDTILLKFKRYRDRLRVLGAEGKIDELVAHYDTYAQSFGKFFEITGYVGGVTMAEAVAKTESNKDAKILDCGCGDGALGSCLQEMGYTDLSGLDPSQAMIDECSKKNIYTNLICDIVKPGHTTRVEDVLLRALLRAVVGMMVDTPDTYDVIAACAAFCPGHMNPKCFNELSRMVKPGGSILFNIAQVYLKEAPDFKDGKLDAAVQAMITAGLWKSVSTHTAPYFTSGVVEDCVVYTIKTAEN